MLTLRGPLLLHFLDEPSDSFADANAKKDLRREVLSRGKGCPHPPRTPETLRQVAGFLPPPTQRNRISLGPIRMTSGRLMV